MSDSVITIPRRALSRIVVGLVFVVLVAALAVVAVQQRDRVDLGGIFARGTAGLIDGSTYQAVFLNGGQVYFGKLAVRGDDYFMLVDVYYLSQTNTGEAENAGQLIKRGTELHGPREPMILPTRQILFIENLRDDSGVVEAIKRFRSGQQTPAPIRTVTPTTTPRPSPTATR